MEKNIISKVSDIIKKSDELKTQLEELEELLKDVSDVSTLRAMLIVSKESSEVKDILIKLGIRIEDIKNSKSVMSISNLEYYLSI